MPKSTDAFKFAILPRLAVVLVLCGCFSQALAAQRRHASSSLDANYIAALAIANRFLQAWQSQNPEDGLLLLSDAAKQRTSEERLEMFFEHRTPAAYEIERGKTIKGGRYAFPVVLLCTAAGSGGVHPRVWQIIVAKTGREDWVVDRLP